MAITEPVLPLVGDVRVAPAGLACPLAENLPFTGTVTASATRDGITNTALTVTESGGVYSATVPVALTGTAGVVRVTWTKGSESVVTSVDVRSSMASLDKLLQGSLANGSKTVTSTYPDWKRFRAISDALLELERECRVCLAPRVSQVTVTGGPGTEITFDEAYVRRVIACSDTSVDLDTATLDTPSSTLTLAAPVTGPVEFVIEHGEQRMEADVQRAVVLLAGARLANGPADDRGFLIHSEFGPVRALTAGVGGAKFSIPDVEATYKRHRVVSVG